MTHSAQILWWIPLEGTSLRSDKAIVLDDLLEVDDRDHFEQIAEHSNVLKHLLSRDELAAMMRPRFIQHLHERGVSGQGVIAVGEQQGSAATQSPSGFLTLEVPTGPFDPFHVTVATTLEGPDVNAIQIDFHQYDPTLIEEWGNWLWDSYLTFPMGDIVDFEKAFLRYQGLTNPAVIIRRTTDSAVDNGTAPPSSNPHDLVRLFHRAVDPAGARWPDPAEPAVQSDFVAWLTQPDERGLPRYAQMVFWSRPDLREAFPPNSTTVNQFVDWLHRTGFTLGSVKGDLPVLATRPRDRAQRVAKRLSNRIRRVRPTMLGDPRHDKPDGGVNVVGYLSSTTGLGAAARASIRALTHIGKPVCCIDTARQIPAPRSPGVAMTPGAFHDTTIYHLNPGELDDYLTRSLMYRSSALRSIGYFFWETETVPIAWRSVMPMVDEIWVATTFVADAFRRATSVPVVHVGYSIEPPDQVQADRSRFGWSADDFIVLFIADARSGIERKNPIALVDAFRRAFPASEPGVKLVLKISNLTEVSEYYARLRQAAEGLTVEFMKDDLDHHAYWTLLASVDLYASLHCSEGLGLTMLEAMTIGVPVLATSYGGNTDFTTPETALMVGYEMQNAPPGPGGIYLDHRWARPDVDEAAMHMRLARNSPSTASGLAAAGQRLVTERFSPSSYAAGFTARLA